MIQEILTGHRLMNAITSDEYRARLHRVRDAMSAARLDALVAWANKTHPGHVRELPGYETRRGIHDSAVCVVTSGRCVLLTNASFDMPQARPPVGQARCQDRRGARAGAEPLPLAHPRGRFCRAWHRLFLPRATGAPSRERVGPLREHGHRAGADRQRPSRRRREARRPRADHRRRAPTALRASCAIG